jgi:Ca2+/H+ antiporter, TMEM165/GDT1 family
MLKKCLLLLVLLLAVAFADNFDRYDSNGDGQLSRTEFGSFIAAARGSMTPFLQEVGDVKNKGLDSFTFDGDDFTSSTVNGLLVILVTELGDKTFFIAAILAMRHGRLVVYTGAMLALGLMHIMSSIMGLALPSILPRKYTHFASAILFLYFGYRLFLDGQEMGDGPSEELQEAEEELAAKSEGEGEDMEEGRKGKEAVAFDLKGEWFKVFSQSFTLTFLAEWGDRSQIATIGLGATKNVWGVILGGLAGHAFCTGLAVVGGKLLSTKISPKSIAYSGAILFIIFGIHALFFED